MKKLMLTIPILLLPFNSTAQDLKVPVAVFASSSAADWNSSLHALKVNGTHEQNPLINWIDSKPTMILAGVGIDILGVSIWTKVMKNHRKLGAIGLYTAAGFRFYLASKNYGIK